MIFVRTFKGYEDKTAELDKTVNQWILSNDIDVVNMKSVLSHEPNSRANSGDLLYSVLYKSDAPIP